VTASRQVFENELQDLEKVMRRKAKARQKAIKENELAAYNLEDDSEDDDLSDDGTPSHVWARW
jgi:hypothetical protein